MTKAELLAALQSIKDDTAIFVTTEAEPIHIYTTEALRLRLSPSTMLVLVVKPLTVKAST